MNVEPILGHALHRYFLDYLPKQRAVSPQTIHSYRDSLKLLLQFLDQRHPGKQLDVQEITVDRILSFLQHIETVRHNAPGSRNNRLSAIRSFFRYFGSQQVQHIDLCKRIIGIPFKRTGSPEIQHLDEPEIRGILKGISRADRFGRRDFALLSLMFNTGARVSELIGVTANDLRLEAPPHVKFHGKRRKDRTCPIWTETAKLMRDLLEENQIAPQQERRVFLNRLSQPLTRFGVRDIIKRRVKKALPTVPSLASKRIHPHSFRHSNAIALLRSGVDLPTIANWLGHEDVTTTYKYLKIDLEAKRAALNKTAPLFKSRPSTGKWRDDPDLISWLAAL